MDDFGRLIEQELPRLRRYAHALVKDPERADDLVQDCLERAWRKSHLWVRRTNLRGWLMTILHNLYANAARKHSHTPTMVSLDDAAAPPATPPSQTETLSALAVREALQTLPPDQQQVLLLVGMEQMQYAEVAELLRIPIGTVMSRLYRARERMRVLLAESTRPTLRRVK
ncbi:MAG TPA: RNA polymerase sigma factor [bacterium]|nr:RNA polymerase sigma factor [bacterium]